MGHTVGGKAGFMVMGEIKWRHAMQSASFLHPPLHGLWSFSAAGVLAGLASAGIVGAVVLASPSWANRTLNVSRFAPTTWAGHLPDVAGPSVSKPQVDDDYVQLLAHLDTGESRMAQQPTTH